MKKIVLAKRAVKESGPFSLTRMRDLIADVSDKLHEGICEQNPSCNPDDVEDDIRKIVVKHGKGLTTEAAVHRALAADYPDGHDGDTETNDISHNSVEPPLNQYNVAADMICKGFTYYHSGRIKPALELLACAMESDGMAQLVKSFNEINANTKIGQAILAEMENDAPQLSTADYDEEDDTADDDDGALEDEDEDDTDPSDETAAIKTEDDEDNDDASAEAAALSAYEKAEAELALADSEENERIDQEIQIAQEHLTSLQNKRNMTANPKKQQHFVGHKQGTLVKAGTEEHTAAYPDDEFIGDSDKDLYPGYGDDVPLTVGLDEADMQDMHVLHVPHVPHEIQEMQESSAIAVHNRVISKDQRALLNKISLSGNKDQRKIAAKLIEGV